MFAGADLGDRRNLIAPAIQDRMPRPQHPRAIPAVAEPDVDRVGAGLEVMPNRIRLERETLVVTGPARRQLIVADPLAVDEATIETERTDAERGITEIGVE